MICPMCRNEVNSMGPVEFAEGKIWLCDACRGFWNNPERVCSVCGKPYETAWISSQDKCFSCGFWSAELAQYKEDWRHIVYQGVKFYIGKGLGSLKGFYGQKFLIHFEDGSTIETDDLWCQGRIPKHLLNQFLEVDKKKVILIEPNMDLWIRLNYPEE